MAPMLQSPRAALIALAVVLAGCAGSRTKPANAGGAAGKPANTATTGSAWGGPVNAPDDEASVHGLLLAVAHSEPERARSSCARFVVAMPALWHGLASRNPELRRTGVPRLVDVAAPDGRHSLPVRIFAGQNALFALLSSPAFTALARQLAGGDIRPASELERKLVYELVGGFEPDSHVTVAQAGALRLAFLLEKRHVFWMELLSAWQPSEWARQPLPEQLPRIEYAAR